jgi:hypothetical protein
MFFDGVWNRAIRAAAAVEAKTRTTHRSANAIEECRATPVVMGSNLPQRPLGSATPPRLPSCEFAPQTGNVPSADGVGRDRETEAPPRLAPSPAAGRLVVRDASYPRSLGRVAAREEGAPNVNSGILAAVLAVIWVVLFIWLGLRTLRRGHWVMFIVGLFIPLFWIIGALIPPTR